MSSIDWFILITTLLGIVGYGIWKNRQQESIQSYIRGGNQSRWWTVGLSVMATQASAITFLSTPGQAFHDGMGFVQFYFGLPFAVILICLFFLPIYHRLNVFTAYEFLEERFNWQTRTLTAILFLIQRGLAAGITIYAPAIILSAILGWPLKGLVIGIGLLVILYTVVGGTQAVNVTQKQQMTVIFLGLIVAFFSILAAFPESINFTQALKIAGASGKLQVLDFSFDPNSRYTFWSGITGGLFLALSYFGTDQSQVQRYLSGKSLKESQMGLLMNGFLKVPLQFFILLVGVMVFVFYQFQPAPLHFNPKTEKAIQETEQAPAFARLESENTKTQLAITSLLLRSDFETNSQAQQQYQQLNRENQQQREAAKKLLTKAKTGLTLNDKDFVFITFILDHLPVGVIGLLLAMIFSAAMSSTASELNALSATTLVDLYQRNRPGQSEIHYVQAAKGFTLLWGLIAIAFASVGNLFENLIQLVNIIGSVFYGTILGIFLVAFFFKSIQGKAVFWGAIVSEITILYIYSQDWVGYLWLNAIGALLTILVAYLFTFIQRQT
ncbi:MAG: sodium:solute symporter [Flavobacteriaceae bacterium]